MRQRDLDEMVYLLSEGYCDAQLAKDAAVQLKYFDEQLRHASQAYAKLLKERDGLREALEQAALMAMRP